ncbi:hypothetical protein GOP47_0003136 [Adiantum capillus-veneris]|uniref:Serine aminopeptidase S33 domain-containing protein n=1 Tax=Adiantum capillus-veneris TaxID=13818 RepID=A0A9D4ZPU3_ADICA|nr:hypothetical protein GOP47_0003136 [Adiantum capillus-veneris]
MICDSLSTTLPAIPNLAFHLKSLHYLPADSYCLGFINCPPSEVSRAHDTPGMWAVRFVNKSRVNASRPGNVRKHFTSFSSSLPPTMGYLLVLAVVVLAAGVGTLYQSTKKSSRKGLAREHSVRSQDIVGSLGNLDHAPARRQVRSLFQAAQQSLDHPLFKESLDGVEAEEFYQINSRGIEIFTKSWLPAKEKIKAIVFICHGYGDTCTFFLEGFSRILAKAGYAVFGMDYPGCGLSAGLHGYIPDFNRLVDDVIENYSSIKARPEYAKLPCFLFGQSMGGAVALKMHLKQETAWNGAILVAPMCKMAAEMYPPWILVLILKAVCFIFPRAKLVPNKNLADLAFRDVKKRIQTAYNVTGYKDPPRLRTALEMLRATDEISSRLHEISLPLLILHGACDVITDPSVSKALYEQSRSLDKTLRIYDEAWHSLLDGEPDLMTFNVFTDIKYWLHSHSS